jgi:hypothetical protein
VSFNRPSLARLVDADPAKVLATTPPRAPPVPMPASEIRAQLIARGKIVPAAEVLEPDLYIDQPTLLLDEAGRLAATKRDEWRR